MRISDPCGHRWTKFFFFFKYIYYRGWFCFSFSSGDGDNDGGDGDGGCFKFIYLFIYGNPFQREREKGMTATTLFSRPVRLKTGQDKVSSLGFMQYDRFL